MATINTDDEKYNELVKITEQINDYEKILFQMSTDLEKNNIEFKTKESGEHYKEMLEFLDFYRKELYNKKLLLKEELMSLNDKGPTPTSFM